MQLLFADDSGDSDSDDEEADPDKEMAVGNASGVVKEVKRAKETRAAEAISALVNYVAAVRFHGFEHAERERTDSAQNQTKLSMLIFISNR